MDVLEGIANSFSDKERKEAAELESKKDQIIKVIVRERESLDRNFVKLAQIINEVRQKKYWLLGNYKNFGEYLAGCETKFGVGHSQIYVGMKIVRNLLPALAGEDLVNMGITKAGVLSKFVEQSGQTSIPDDILQIAKDPDKKTEDLEIAVNAKLHNVPLEKGTWINLGGFFCTEEEKQEINDALELAGSIDPVVPNNIPAWQQHREKVLRLAREFLGSYDG